MHRVGCFLMAGASLYRGYHELQLARRAFEDRDWVQMLYHGYNVGTSVGIAYTSLRRL